MGTTCACAWVIDDRLYTANLGDSRIYLLRGEHLIQLTTDHTWIQEALDAGIITEAERGKHPNAHVIRRFLGSEKIPQPDFRLWFYESESGEEALENQGLPLLSGDKLLLCSDGLTDLVTDDEICAVLLDDSRAGAPETLIKMANQRGGHDNTTVVTLTVPGGTTSLVKKANRRRKLVGWLSLLVILGMVISVVIWRQPLSEIFQAGNMTETPTEAADQPAFVGTTAPIFPSSTNTVTTTAESIDSQGMPIPTLTPWPTHTQAP
jgi:PPM family protein phosphatase